MDGQMRIDSVFAFVVVDDDGTEGIPAFLAEGNVVMPMMGADLAMVDRLRPVARQWAIENGKAACLVHFSRRTVQETYEPDGSITHGRGVKPA
jgi:hypothetical protein